MNQTTAVILAGGEGKRFQPFVTDKTLFPFLGKPLLAHTIEAIVEAGFKKIILATNNQNQQWIKANRSSFNIEIVTKMQSNPLGMADALLELEELIGNQSILVMNAVDLVDKQLLADLAEKTQSSQALIVGKKVTSHMPAGYLSVQGDRVVGIVEKPAKGEEPSDLINLVFHYFKNPVKFFELLNQIDTDGDDVYELALDEYINQVKVSYFAYQGAWSKLKYPHFVLDVANQLLQTSKKKIHPTAKVHKTAIIEGEVFIDEDVVVHEYAVIKGPSYIGKKTIIGNFSLVMNSNIENNCVVGAHSEVSRSYLGPRTWLHHNFVGDSVLEADINPSYGTCFANLRLDKQNIRLTLPSGVVETDRTKLGTIAASGMFSGINSNFMPGTVVGPDMKLKPNGTYKGLITNQD